MDVKILVSYNRGIFFEVLLHPFVDFFSCYPFFSLNLIALTLDLRNKNKIYFSAFYGFFSLELKDFIFP